MGYFTHCTGEPLLHTQEGGREGERDVAGPREMDGLRILFAERMDVVTWNTHMCDHLNILVGENGQNVLSLSVMALAGRVGLF